MIQVTHLDTGEVQLFTGQLMVALNGVIFIKHNKKVLFASGSTNIVVEDLDG